MDERLPPVDIEAEEALLGSILIDQESIYEVADIVESVDFYREVNKWLYEAMFFLSENQKAIDLVTLSSRLRQMEQLEEVGGEAYIIGLMNVVPTSMNARYYAEIVRNRATRRRLITTASMIANISYSDSADDDGSSAVDTAEQLLHDLRSTEQKGAVRSAKVVSGEYMEHLEMLQANEGKQVGLPTGFLDYDRLLNGIPGGALMLVAARPSMGKTALMLQIAMENAMNGKNVLFFSLEMSAFELVQRITSTITRIDSQNLRRGVLTDSEWPVFYQTCGEISESGLFIDDTSGITTSQIRSRSKQTWMRHGLDLIVVDYLQLVQADGNLNSRVQQLSSIGRGLKVLARQLDIPLIAASQLNRGVESRNNKRPQLSDLRDSGTLEEDADIVSFIYREDYYNTEMPERPNIAEINTLKHRNGPTGVVDLFWQGHLATFRNLQRQEIDLNPGLSKKAKEKQRHNNGQEAAQQQPINL